MTIGIAEDEEAGLAEMWAERPPLDRCSSGKSVDAIIISDIHLGTDNCQAKAVATFLQRLLDGELTARRLIINGDVFDSIDFRRLKKSHWKVLSQIRHLSDKLEIIWIAGNHDGSAEIISHLLGVRVEEQFILRTGGRRLLVIHGHQFDSFINDHPILTWLADCAYWLLQKLDHTHYVARLAKRRSKVFVRCAAQIRRGAMEMAAQLGCDGVICGHTHHFMIEESGTHGTVAYYNCGCWTELPSTYLMAEEGKVRLEIFANVKDRACAGDVGK